MPYIIDDEIDSLCDQFEQEFSSSDESLIPTFLMKVASVKRPSLFVELLRIELELRQQSGQALTKDQCQDRFADYFAEVEYVFTDSREFFSRIRCPHCRQLIEVLETDSDVTCSCGETFNLVGMLRSQVPQGSPGKTYGNYRLIEEVGIGAFGTVWKARDTKLERDVAFKLPKNPQLSGQELIKFLQEAQAASHLSHQNIVSVHEIHLSDDPVYIVSDFIEGQTLSAAIEKKQLSIETAIQIAVKLANALQYAHDRGVVHRDVKPSNILLDSAVEPYLTDFGLAKREATEITMTMTGVLLGTPAYMSPEQAKREHKKIDARSDIYSLGVVLFEMLTDQRPFHGDIHGLINQIQTEEPASLRKLNSNISKDLETICLKCLQKDPNKRYQRIEEVAQELERVLNREPIIARPISQLEYFGRWCQRNQRVAVLAGSLLAILILITISAPIVAWQQAELRFEAQAQRDTAKKLAREKEVLADKEKSTRLREEREKKKAKDLAEKNASIAASEKKARQEIERQIYLSEVIQSQDLNSRNQGLSSLNNALKIPFHQRDFSVNQLIRELVGTPLIVFAHSDAITKMLFTVDGEKLVTSSKDGTIKEWNFLSAELEKTIEAFPEGVDNLVFSKKQDLVIATNITGSQVKMKCWSYPNWEPQPQGRITAELGLKAKILLNHRYKSSSITENLILNFTAPKSIPLVSSAISPDQSQFAIEAEYAIQIRLVDSKEVKGPVLILDSKTHKIIHQLNGLRLRLMSLSYSPDGRFLLGQAGNPGAVQWLIWDTEKGEISGESGVRNFPSYMIQSGRSFQTLEAGFTPDQSRLYSRLTNGWASINDIKDDVHGDINLKTTTKQITACALTPSGHQIVVGDSEGCIKVKNAYEEDSHNNYQEMSCGNYSEDGLFKVIGTNNGDLILWNYLSKNETKLTKVVNQKVQLVAMNPKNDLIAIYGYNKKNGNQSSSVIQKDLFGDEIKNWASPYPADYQDASLILIDRNSKEILWKLSLEHTEGKYLEKIKFSTDQKKLIAVRQDGLLIIQWNDAWMKPQIESIPLDADFINVSPDGNSVIYQDHALDIHMMSLENKSKVTKLNSPDSKIEAATLTHDSKRLLTGGADASIKVWDIETGIELNSFDNHKFPIKAIAVHPCNQLAASLDNNGYLKLWDAESGLELNSFKTPSRSFDFRFSKAGDKLLVLDQEYPRVLDSKLTQQCVILGQHNSKIIKTAIDDYSDRCLSASEDGVIKLWDYHTAKLIHTFRDMKRHAQQLAFSKDGRRFFAQHVETHEIYEWDIESKSLIEKYDKESWNKEAEYKYHNESDYQLVPYKNQLRLVKSTKGDSSWRNQQVLNELIRPDFHIKGWRYGLDGNSSYMTLFHLSKLLEYEHDRIINNKEAITPIDLWERLKTNPKYEVYRDESKLNKHVDPTHHEQWKQFWVQLDNYISLNQSVED